MSAGSLGELAYAIAPAADSHRALALLEAYFDESGMHGSARAMVVAGAVGLPDQWRAVEKAWRHELDKLGVAGFHMQPCQRGLKEFEHLAEADRHRLIAALAEALCEGGVTVVGSAIELDAWNAMQAPGLRERFPKPYNLAFEHCIQQINSWSADNADGQAVALTFAETQEFAKRSAEVGEAYRRSKRHGTNIHAFTFADARVFGMVQAADMIAYETWRWAEQTISGDAALRPVMEALSSTGRMTGGLYRAQALAELEARGPIGVL